MHPTTAVITISRALALLGAMMSMSLAFAAIEDSWHDHSSLRLELLLQDNPARLAELDRADLKSFYRERDHRLFWSDQEGRLARAHELLDAVTHTHEEGLVPAEYYLAELRRLWHRQDIAAAVELDLWLSAALIRYAQHVHSGVLDPHEVDDAWHLEYTPLDVASLLEEIAGSESIAARLRALPPRHGGYRAMKTALAGYRELAGQGGWPALRAGPILKLDRQHGDVLKLKHRLRLSGDLVDDPYPDSDYYDAWVERAVLRYQKRHGLILDGQVGPSTKRSMNASIEERIEQIELNMERWRWLPRDLGTRYLMVNMAGFELDIVHGEEVELSMPIIIGKAYRETPTFGGMISYLEYNPYWTIPKRIMWEDYIPKARRNPDYLDARSIKLYHGWAEPVEVDPASVDWRDVSWDNSPYWMRQDPGPGNALGRVKFMFSNPYQIYLHGTPDRYLFQRAVRTYSSGCIRVEDPVKLAAFLLEDGSLETEEAIMQSILDGTNERKYLPVRTPVYLLYWTAWVDENGIVNFRDDIYGRDRVPERMLTSTAGGHSG